MKKKFFALVGAIATFLLAAGLSIFSPGNASAAGQAVVPNCGTDIEYCVDWHASYSGNFTEGDWEDNDSPQQYERGFVHCQNGRSYQLDTGGWVKTEELESRATCSSAYTMVGGGIDIKTCSSCSFVRHWVTGRLAI
jgi:hypothetical protein